MRISAHTQLLHGVQQACLACCMQAPRIRIPARFVHRQRNIA